MNPLPSPPTSLIGRCLRRLRGKELTKYLQGFAAEVVITARMTSPAAAGRTLGNELIGEPLSPTPILNILAMVESGEIPMTRERLKAVVDQDEGAIRFYTLNPWIIDPTGQSAPPTKKGRKPRIQEVPEQPSPPKKVKSTAPKAKTVALPPTVVVEPTEPAAEVPEEETDESSDKPRKRTTVEMPPDYKPGDYLPKPPPPLEIHISGLPPTDAD